MIIDFKELKKAPELIPVHLIEKIINRSDSTVSRLVHKYKIDRVFDGNKSYIVKDSLIKALKKARARSKELLVQS